ncbi:MAG: MBL fold metallo-hydrolase [bacterium]|nr:MBL fold metallo-hydrolase [bacterium]
MVVTYFGDGCFRFQSGERSLLVDSNNNRLKADIELKTLTPVDGAPESPTEITYAGEYEIGGIEIQGFEVEKESTQKFVKTVYAIEWEDTRIVVLGHISKALDPEIAENFDEIDVLVVPMGGEHFLSAGEAKTIVKQLEPSIVLPSFYGNPSALGKALDRKIVSEEKLVFKKKELKAGEGKIIVLESKTS